MVCFLSIDIRDNFSHSFGPNGTFVMSTHTLKVKFLFGSPLMFIHEIKGVVDADPWSRAKDALKLPASMVHIFSSKIPSSQQR